MNSTLLHLFPSLTEKQCDQFDQAVHLYTIWNDRINVISRKDILHLEDHHILHSLSIGLAFQFLPGTRIMDAGTGGGFPGIPLAILFPDVEFTLVDSIAKKIDVVRTIKNELGLTNVILVRERFENIKGTFEFITGRALTNLPDLVRTLKPKINKFKVSDQDHGIIYLKGGDFIDELSVIHSQNKVYDIARWIPDPWFETKKIVHLFNFS
ncbi:MAG: 16S rRNA (guanine(527)-N(7))-methyltransferase RsmG, partial [Bacteroidota bacterium]